jgi:hypothetical protein
MHVLWYFFDLDLSTVAERTVLYTDLAPLDFLPNCPAIQLVHFLLLKAYFDSVRAINITSY